MVDHTKWNSGDVIAMGVLNRIAPPEVCPSDAKLQRIDDDDGSEETIRKALQAGGISASMYYGCWKMWKDADGYSGELRQYRVVTDQFTRISLDNAVEKAQEWWSVCYG